MNLGKSTRGTFVLHLARLLGFGDEQSTWCVHGLMMRLAEFREASDNT